MSESVDFPFEHISAFINEYDLAFCNLECPVATTGRSTGKLYCFRADTTFFLGVQNAGFNLFSLANNHIIDWGDDACLDTKSFIEKRKLFTFGAGKDQKEALEPLLINMNGLKLALFASVGFPLKDMIWPLSKPGPAQASLEQLATGIDLVRDSVDFIIVSMHWGTEYEHIPKTHQMTWAHALIDAGADLIIGHHPHVLQSIEKYKGRIILYSLGNFVFDQRKLYQRQSGIFSCVFKDGRIDSACFHPVIIENFQPKRAEENDFETIVQKIKQMSVRYKTVFLKKENCLFITDSSCVLYIDTPLMRTRIKDMTVYINRGSIEMFDSTGSLQDRLILPQDQEIKDCCYFKDSTGGKLFTITHRMNNTDGDFVSQFSIKKSGIVPEYCIQEMQHRLWKIKIADINCDSIPEICVGAHKVGTLERDDNFLLLYRWNGAHLHKILASSRKLNPLIDFSLRDIDNDGLDDLISLEPCSTGTYTVVVYQWLGFDFVKYRELCTGLEKAWLSDIDPKQYLAEE